ncbi:MAG: prepilin peptidase [Gammaproteobacteria bacterium]
MQFIELLQTSPAGFYFSIGLLGLLVGSFLNVVIVRLPLMMERDWRKSCCEFLEVENTAADEGQTYNLLQPRSRCLACGHSITVMQNIPLLSYLLLGGKCANCEAGIGIRYPLVELLACLLCLSAAWKFGPHIQTLPACILGCSLIALVFIDYDKQLLPDEITLPLLWAGIVSNLFGVFTDIYSSIIGCILGYLILWGVYHLFKLLTGKQGIGHGDFKLLAALGAWLGWQYLPLVILLSSLVGSIIGIGMIILRRHKRETPIPFGPYLAIAGWISLIQGREILALFNHEL